MDALVVGAGEMGRWVGDALAEAGFDLAFADTDPGAADRAATAVDGARTTTADAEDAFTLVCVAVPIPATTDAVAAWAGRADRALVDVTGTMAAPVAAMADHAPDRERVSLHPLFAPANEPGNVAVVADAAGPVTDTLRETLADRGNHVFETTAEEHDRAMETVQARAHTAVLAYALAAESVPEEFHTPVSAGLADLAEGVTGGEGRVYADIQAAFEGAGDVADAAGRLAAADRERFLALYEDAG
jgi:prephenate dehydrogenase